MTLRAFISRTPEGRLQRKLLAARLVLLAERLWHALFWPLLVAGLWLLLAVSGVLAALPAWPRWLLTAALLIAAIWLGRDAWRVRWPSRAEGLARLEEQSQLAHQPLRTLADEVAVPADDAAARALWQAHRKRISASLRQLRVGWPRSDAPRRDPWALRHALVMMLIVAFIAQGGNDRWWNNLRQGLQWPVLAGAAARPVRIDAWIDPPSFLRTPPLMLARNGELLHAGEVLSTLAGARLMLRLQGVADAPVVELWALDPQRGQVKGVLRREALQKVETGAWQARVLLNRPVEVRLSGAGVQARWRIDVAADMPPLVSVEGQPLALASGALQLQWKATDDHGVRTVRAEVALRRPQPGMLHYEPPKVQLKMSKPGREVRGRDMLKLMAHPWAGLAVRLTLVATDVAGQEGRSQGLEMVLPQRRFTQPLARALIEQRRALVLRPAQARQVAEMLAAFLAWPEGLLPQGREAAVYLGLRQAMQALLQADGEEELKQVVALLWEIAEDIEDGDVAAARRQLEAARRALREALRNGASEEEIARRVEELREAMNRFMQSLAQRQAQQGQRQQPMTHPQGQVRMVRPEDLQRMMEQIERMARSGARDAAERLLSQLDDILNNLQMVPPAAMRPSPQEQALGQLQRLMREQQKLLDETWRQAQRQQRQRQLDPQGDATQPDEQLQALQRQQQALAEALRELMRQMQQQGQQQGDRQGAQQPGEQQGRRGENGMPGAQGMPGGGLVEGQQRREGAQGEAGGGNDPLGRARQAMRGAAGELGRGRAGSALAEQMRALQALRQGARQLQRRMARQRGQGGGAQAGFMRPRHDPLGRPLRGQFMDPGPDRQMLPPESAMERARRILEQLRRRAEDATRPALERHYIERLLRDLY